MLLLIFRRPVVHARRGQRELLPDQQAQLVAEAVETLPLQERAAPDAQQVAAQVAVELQPLAVVRLGHVGEVRPDRRPVHALQEDRLAVDDADPRVRPGGRALAGPPLDVLEADGSRLFVLDAAIRPHQATAHRVERLVAEAVRLPELDGQISQPDVKVQMTAQVRCSGRIWVQCAGVLDLSGRLSGRSEREPLYA